MHRAGVGGRPQSGAGGQEEACIPTLDPHQGLPVQAPRAISQLPKRPRGIGLPSYGNNSILTGQDLPHGMEDAQILPHWI